MQPSTTTSTIAPQPQPPLTHSSAIDTFLADQEAASADNVAVVNNVDDQEEERTRSSYNSKTQLQHMVDFLPEEEEEASSSSYHHHPSEEISPQQQQHQDNVTKEPIHHKEEEIAAASSPEGSVANSEVDDIEHPQPHRFEASDVLLLQSSEARGSPDHDDGDNVQQLDNELDDVVAEVVPPREPSSESYNPNDALETTTTTASSSHPPQPSLHDSSFESEGAPLPPKRTSSTVKAASYYTTEY